MSIKIMSLVWSAYDIITDESQLLIMLALADWSNDQGVSWPSMAALAKKSRMSARQARYIVLDLEDCGLISVTIRRGRNHTNLFKINQHSLQVLIDKTCTEVRENLHSGPIKPARYNEAPSDEPLKAEPSKAEAGEKPARTAEEISRSKAVAALQDVVCQVDKFNTSKARIAVKDKIALSVIQYDCGGKDWMKMLARDGPAFRAAFVCCYVKRELAEFVKMRGG